MAKQRTTIPADSVAVVMLACDRTCCVCQVPGKFVQIHHIDEDPSNHAEDNLVALCFQCHGETQIRGGFGRKLDAEQVRLFRKTWNERVAMRRHVADELATRSLAGADKRTGPITEDLAPWGSGPPAIPERISLTAYVNALPEIREAAYSAADAGFSGSTVEMIEATSLVIDVIREALVRLVRYYPKGHFGDDPEQFIDQQISSRYLWHGHIAASGGHGYSGTIVGPITSAGVLADLEHMVEQIIGALTMGDDLGGAEGWDLWRQKWRRVHGLPDEDVQGM